MLSKLLRMQEIDNDDDDNELAYQVTSSDAPKDVDQSTDGRPSWMRTLSVQLQIWLRIVPQVCELSPHVKCHARKSISILLEILDYTVYTSLSRFVNM